MKTLTKGDTAIMSDHKYFRLLEKGEQTQHGDVEGDRLDLVTGAGTNNPPFNIFRPVQVDEWIEYAKQKPTKEDYPINVRAATGKVGFAHEEYSCYPGRPMTTGGASGNGFTFEEDATITHWRRVTPPTLAPVVKPILIDGKELKFNADGSIHLSCGTKIDAVQVDEIFKRREAAKA